MGLAQYLLFQKVFPPNSKHIILKMKYGTLSTDLNAHALILFYVIPSYYKIMTSYSNTDTI